MKSCPKGHKTQFSRHCPVCAMEKRPVRSPAQVRQARLAAIQKAMEAHYGIRTARKVKRVELD